MSLSGSDVPFARLPKSQSSWTQSFFAAQARKAAIQSSRISIVMVPIGSREVEGR
jgi:hypothetical protein